jgi:hypothetical protein
VRHGKSSIEKEAYCNKCMNKYTNISKNKTNNVAKWAKQDQIKFNISGKKYYISEHK